MINTVCTVSIQTVNFKHCFLYGYSPNTININIKRSPHLAIHRQANDYRMFRLDSRRHQNWGKSTVCSQGNLHHAENWKRELCFHNKNWCFILGEYISDTWENFCHCNTSPFHQLSAHLHTTACGWKYERVTSELPQGQSVHHHPTQPKVI